MKKLNIILILSLFSTIGFSIDRVVQYNGPVGTYNSIAAAVSAAVDGDIIVINNKPSNIPWIEDIIIDKSLTFISALDTVNFLVQGNYSIEKAANRNVIINGMKNAGGEIQQSGAVSPASKTKVSILNCDLNGSVSIGHHYDLLVSNSIMINLAFTYGNAFGNKISGYVNVSRDNFASDDTIKIAGNFIHNLWLNTDSQYVSIFNNYIYNTDDRGIYITALKTGNSENLITNNSIFSNQDAILLYGSSPSKLVVQNNALRANNSLYFSFDSNTNSLFQLAFYYNIYHSIDNVSLVGNSTNIQLSKWDILFNNDGSNNFLQGDDAGNPSHYNLDLDLSINDIGCYGGSYSMENFQPINNHKSSRAGYINTPRVVNQGDSFTISGFGFDK